MTVLPVDENSSLHGEIACGVNAVSFNACSYTGVYVNVARR